MRRQKTRPSIHRQPCGSGLRPLATLALTLSVLAGALVVVLAMEATTSTRETAMLAEAKQSLNAIQLAVERFWVDNDEYPAYLTGGSQRARAGAPCQARRQLHWQWPAARNGHGPRPLR